MTPICIIPARGGSKGLPRKNVLPLCGRPLLAWNVLAAVEACGAGNVYVTTDDSEIAAVGEPADEIATANQAGDLESAKPPFREPGRRRGWRGGWGGGGGLSLECLLLESPTHGGRSGDGEGRSFQEAPTVQEFVHDNGGNRYVGGFRCKPYRCAPAGATAKFGRRA